ncbi:3-keto-5-aminohexanoate cleavage protein [Hahella ganghwensis]|uniref:3-keto-5-aminohexanoate cleavage protein n=1 Tax=Hahella ganghwensis TaxID=286420 RepID=UPI0003611A8D|nr:3-keto-5-aminohexanoate cleavage protein [Hahella ganghwensis]
MISGEFSFPPALIMVAPNGARKGRGDHKRVPLSPEEMAECAVHCQQAGAAMIHLHARDEAGQHSLEPELNRRFIDQVKTAVGNSMIVQMTTEAVGIYTPEQQMTLVREVVPEAVSLAIAEILPQTPGIDERKVADFLAWVSDSGILPQYILYDAGDVRRYHQLKSCGIIPAGGHHLLFVVGRRGRGHPADLASMLAAHTDETPWAVCGFGALEFPVCAAALAMGGDIRVGFENNLFLHHGDLASDNCDLVIQGVIQAQQLNRNIYSATEFKSRLM